jgi:hypothetical protein
MSLLKRSNRTTFACLFILVSFVCQGTLRGTAVAFPSDDHGANAGTVDNPRVVPRTDNEILVDAILDEQAWHNALTIDLPYETDPGENIPAPIQTDARLLYDDSHLYIGFRAYDPDPKLIRARYTDRDQIWNDDYVLIFLDTFNDERRAFALRSNPYGIQADDIRLPNSQAIGWDAIYESQGRITDWGYIVEMAIPFHQLRFQRDRDDQIWGINIMRFYPRNVLHELSAVPIDRNNDSILSQFIKIRGFQDVSPGRNVDVVPSVVSAQTDHRPDFPEGDMSKLSRDVEAGISARWGFTPNLTLSGTLNPDFSQVEADAYQLDINQPFALWYSEKRPFFQESSDYFTTLKSVVYTRVIREPLLGVKMTGKENKNTIGAYIVKDEITNLIFPGSQGSSSSSLDMNNTSAVLRYKRDLGRSYTLGLMATDREGKEYYNRLIGMDGDFRITNSDRLRLQALGSRTAYPGNVAGDFDQGLGNLDDYFIALEYDHDARNWGWWLDYDDVGPQFRADLGFVPMVDYRNVEGGVNYTWYGKPGSWWTYFYLSSELNYYEDHDHNPLTKNASLNISYGGIMQSHAHVQGNTLEESFGGRIFDLTNFSSCFGFWPTGNIWLHTHFLWGDRIDYTNTRLGNRFRCDPEVDLNLGRHLHLGLYHLYERMTVDSGHLYTANISQLSAVYHLNVRTFFRSIIQYVNYDYNVENYTTDIDPEYRYLFTQLLFSYKINPFTVFFLGYSDNHQGNQSYDLTQQDRTFFVKIGYAWTQ